MDDTSDAARAAQVAALRRLGQEGRLRVAVEMSEEARAISIAGIRLRHPEYSEEDARRAVFRGIYGDELADKVERAKSSR